MTEKKIKFLRKIVIYTKSMAQGDFSQRALRDEIALVSEI